MISKVAPPATEAAGLAPPAPADAADSGVFDVLLTLHSLASAEAPPEEAEMLAGMLEDPTDEPAGITAESADDPLWFLNTLLPAPRLPPNAGSAGAAVAAQSRPDASKAGLAPAVIAHAAAPADPAQVLTSGAATTQDAEAPSAVPNIQPAATPLVDTTTWSSLAGPAEFLAQSRHGGVERAESASIPTHVRDPRWADDLGNRLASMVRTGESSASLQLTPVDLGPLEVNVTVRDNQATVHFGATNAETRALLEASMPRLREMLAAQGFQLMDSSVSHGFARQTRHEAAGTPRLDALGESPAVTAQPIHISGLLDLYA
jgi:flagellar hook-length control protein FliK